MSSFERPGVPGLRARGGSRSEGEERSALGHRVAHKARTGEHLPGLVHMVVVMAPEAPGPVSVPNVIGVSCPVYIHCGKDVTTVYGEDRVDRLCDFGPLTLENIRVILSVISFDEQTHVVLNFIRLLVIFDQCIEGKLLDPGQSVRNKAGSHRLVHSRFGREEDVRRPVVAIHTIHEVGRELFKVLIREFHPLVSVNHYGPVSGNHFHPGDVLMCEVCCFVIDFFTNNHVPVNSGILTEIGRSASGLRQETDLLGSIFFVVAEIGILN